MDTLTRLEFVAQLVASGLLSAQDGVRVLNLSVQRPESFIAELAAHGLEVEQSDGP